MLGFVYAGLATSLCSLAAGCLLYVRSAHDEARRAAAAILLLGGSHISRVASTLLEGQGREPVAAAAAAAPVASGEGGSASGAKPGGGASAEERFRCHLAQLTGEGGSAAAQDAGGSRASGATEEQPGDPPSAACAEFQRQWARLKRSLGMVRQGGASST